MPRTFSIPVMSIQDVLVRIEHHPETQKLIKWIEETIEKERINWGIKGKGYKMDYDLEMQWFPIFTFYNRWLADAFINRLIKKGGQ